MMPVLMANQQHYHYHKNTHYTVLIVNVTDTRPRPLGQHVWPVIQAVGLNDRNTGLIM